MDPASRRELETLCSLLPFFRGLRPHELVRVVERFQLRALPLELEQSLAVVIRGRATLDGERAMFAGDTCGEVEVVARRGKPMRLEGDALVAVLDAAALDQLFAELPALALSFVGELGHELKWRNDLLREVVIARAERLPEAQIEAMLGRRRRRLLARRGSSLARTLSLGWQALVAEPARRPTFWMFVGAVSALVSARSVVGMILKNGLQKRLFALIGGGDGRNPIHIHHFNYGLILVSLVGLLSLVPRVRRSLRFLSFAFGFGMGLVTDEFALLWNLNPDYYQPSSRLAAALVLFVLFQVVWFRSLYLALARRLWARLTS